MPTSNAVSLFFDPDTEEKIRACWADVAEKAKVPNQLGLIPKSRPHLSLGIFEDGDMDAIFLALSALAQSQASFAIEFGALGIFDGSRGILFFAPTASRQLIAFHEKCHARLAGLAKTWKPLYCPEKLVFHCSINIGLPKEYLLRAAGAAMDTHLPFQATIASLGLLQLPDGKDNCAFPLAG